MLYTIHGVLFTVVDFSNWRALLEYKPPPMRTTADWKNYWCHSRQISTCQSLQEHTQHSHRDGELTLKF